MAKYNNVTAMMARVQTVLKEYGEWEYRSRVGRAACNLALALLADDCATLNEVMVYAAAARFLEEVE